MTRYEMVVIWSNCPGLRRVAIWSLTSEMKALTEPMVNPPFIVRNDLYNEVLYFDTKEKIHGTYRSLVWLLLSGFMSQGWEQFNILADKDGYETFYLRRRIDD